MSRNASRGSLWKVSVRTTPAAEDVVGEAMAGVFGEPASVYTDLAKRTTVVSVFVPRLSGAHRSELRRQLTALKGGGVDAGLARITARRIPRENWAESWKRHFQPLEISPKLVVRPSWIRRPPRPGLAVVVLDPGLSFGTGHHPTTGFCLEQIAQLRTEGARQSLLDAGCGSGILSIAAAKLGYAPIEAFDFDPDAVRVARANAVKNGVRFRLARQDLTRLPVKAPRRFDLVCANLIYDLLIQEHRRLLARLAPGGTLVLAGILKGQFPAVRRAYEAAGMKLVAQKMAGEWRSGAFRFAQAARAGT